MVPIILSRESTIPSYRWKQYFIVRDASVVILDMTPAWLGWNVRSVDRQGEQDWPGMTRDEIVRFRLANDKHDARVPTVVVTEAHIVSQVLELEKKYQGHTGLVKRED
jgi:hypothetical protein